MIDDAYRPLDLSGVGNAGIEVLGDAAPPAGGGLQLFKGLPFLIGEAERALVLFDGRAESVTIPVNARAYTVVFAHRLLGSELMSGALPGETVATYAFELADGTQHTVPIRERFEIGDIGVWGQSPFLAEADQLHTLHQRWSGRWSDAGVRQMESISGSARWFYLWSWTNPTPEAAIEKIRIDGRNRRFVIAGVTLGSTDEAPFVRSASVPVRIDLKDAALAAQVLGPGAADVQVLVDRGTASYVYQLPRESNDEFLGAGFAGWGERRNAASTPLYAEVGAIPSARLAVTVGEQKLEEVRWGDVLAGPVDTNQVRVQVIEDGRNWVETVVVDDATNQPVPCRVHFRSSDGVPYQPHGHHSHVNSNHDTWHIDVGGDLRLGQISYAYTDGRCQGWLPRGEVIVDVARGYEYEPLRQRVTIAPGQRRLELRLRRWTDMNAQGWYSGDTHVHFLSTQGSLFEAQAEDLNVVNLLQSQWGSLFTNTEDFTGEPAMSPDGRTIVWANQENRQHLMGHMILLGLRQPVYPWCSDGPSEAELGGTMETTLAAWADACHAQGGTVILPHFPNPNGEPASLIATGRIDGVEMIVQSPFNHLEYYRYLNAGYRLPLVGGTDKMSNGVAVGQYRTYVRIPPEEGFSYASWCRNLARGRTFMSGGPVLDFTVDGALIGDTVSLPEAGGSVEVTATARSILPIHTLQIIHNGEVIAESDNANGTRTLHVNRRVTVTRNSWFCARVGGPQYEPLPHHDVWSRGVFGHTSPIFVACGGEWSMGERTGLEYMLTLVGGSLEYIRHHSPQRPADKVTHHHGEQDHLAYLERPFLEAQAALAERLRASPKP